MWRCCAIAVGSAKAFLMTDYSSTCCRCRSARRGKRVWQCFTPETCSRKPVGRPTDSPSYTWRGDVTLDRPYYFTEDQLFLTNIVDMPSVLDYALSSGYLKHDRQLAAVFSQQATLGGGDIRRQDLPFVSNKVNFSKIGAMGMYPIPGLRDLLFQASYSYVLTGRNVGQSSTFMVGAMYKLHFLER